MLLVWDYLSTSGCAIGIVLYICLSISTPKTPIMIGYYNLLLSVSLVFVFALSACVSPRVVEDLKKKTERCEAENESLKNENEKLTTSNNEINATLEDIRKRMKGLERDTSIMGTSLEKMTKNYNQINDLYELLLQKNRELLTGNQNQNTKLMTKLQLMEEDLQRREDELKMLERALDKKKGDLDLLKGELKTREERVNELEKIINDQDQAVAQLKQKVLDALRGFENKGLTVEERNGKVYVSLEAKLLFPSGSIVVDSQGKSALVKLAQVLEVNKEVNILVEGHTDTDKYRGTTGGIKDNWDLSVLRATSVVKILKDNSTITPDRITAAGRGEFVPVDPSDTEDAKKKNRRIEVILTPKLDELFELLNSN